MANLPTTRLYRVDIRDNQPELVLDLDEQGWYGYSFNPNLSNELIFAGREHRISAEITDLYSLNTDTLAITRLTETPDVAERAPLWSPDGQSLAYGGYGGVRLIDRQGNETSTPNVYADVHRYTWSPDGNWFLSVGGYRNPGLYLTSRETGESVQISDESAAYVSWSPDGARIAYVTVGSPGNNQLVIVPAEELGLTLPISNVILSNRHISN
jgi:Tol biopolymer transport system component